MDMEGIGANGTGKTVLAYSMRYGIAVTHTGGTYLIVPVFVAVPFGTVCMVLRNNVGASSAATVIANGGFRTVGGTGGVSVVYIACEAMAESGRGFCPRHKALGALISNSALIGAICRNDLFLYPDMLTVVTGRKPDDRHSEQAQTDKRKTKLAESFHDKFSFQI